LAYKRSLEDFLAFGKVISAALVLCGFLILGLFIGRKLQAGGWPDWIVPAFSVFGALVGSWQAWIFVKQTWKKK